MTERWDNYFLRVALEQAKMSKDPSTKVGTIVVGPDKEIRSTGFNGFPRGIPDDERLMDRDTKYELIIHAEMNALINALRVGVSVKDCTMYMIAIDAEGTVWSGVPCVRCAVHLIQAGISGLVFIKSDIPDRWKISMMKSRILFQETNVSVREVDFSLT